MEEDCSARREQKGGRPGLGNQLVFRKQPRCGHLGKSRKVIERDSMELLWGPQAMEGTELLH